MSILIFIFHLCIFYTTHVYSMSLMYDAMVAVEELIFPTQITISYNNAVPETDRLALNENEQNFLHGKMLLWKSVAEKWKEELPKPIYHIITTIPSVNTLLGDSVISRYKNIIEQTYAFSPNRKTHLYSKGLIVSEEIFRQKLLYLEILLYNNTPPTNIEKNQDFMISRFNKAATDTNSENDRVQDFLFRHQNCGFDKAKLLATIFVLYLP